MFIAMHVSMWNEQGTLRHTTGEYIYSLPNFLAIFALWII